MRMTLILLAKATFTLLALEVELEIIDVVMEIINVNSVWAVVFETHMSQASRDVKLLLSYKGKRNKIRLYGCHKTKMQHGNWERE